MLGLSIYANRKVVSLFFLGFSSGLPLLLVFSTLSFWLSEAGIQKSSIGMLSWVALAYAVKFLWSPLIDNFKIPVLSVLLGRRRSWMLLSQAAIVASLCLMGFADPNDSILLFAGLALIVAFCSATQDIVIDAFRIDSAPVKLQAAMSATYLAGYRIAMITSGAGSLLIAAWLSPNIETYSNQAWQQTYQLMALLMLPGILTTLLVKEPDTPSAHALPTSNNPLLNALNTFWHPILDFMKRYGKIAIPLLLLISVYRLSDVVMGVMANPFYIDMGFNKAEIASVAKVYGVIMTILGAVLGGIILQYTSTLKTLFLGGLLAATTNILFMTLSLYGDNLTLLTLVISADNLSAGIATAAFIAFLSGLTNKAFSATQYAIFSSTMLLLPKFIAGFSGFAVEAYSYTIFFIGTAVLGIPALLLIMYLIKHQTQLNLEGDRHD